MYMDSWLHIEKHDDVNHDILKSFLTIPNPDYVNAIKMKFPTDGVPRVQELFMLNGDEILIPRQLYVNYPTHKIRDNRSVGFPVSYNFTAQLSPTETRPEDQKDFVSKLHGRLLDVNGAIGQADPGYGKFQSVDSLLWTENGPVRMGDIQVGSRIYGKNGKLCTVTGVYPQGEQDCYKVTFTDGSSTESGGPHLWTVQRRGDRSKKNNKWQTITLDELVKKGLSCEGGRSVSWYIPMAEPLDFPHAEVALHPYVLGCLLGDGGLSTKTVRLSNPEMDIIESVRKLLPRSCEVTCGGNGKDWGITNLAPTIRMLGLLGLKSHEKFIPKSYLYADIGQRISLLRGLFDTDGSVTCGGKQLEYTTTSEQLAYDVQFLVESLGGTAVVKHRTTWYSYRGEQRVGKLSYRLTIVVPEEVCLPFNSKKHSERYKKTGKYQARRGIKSVDYVGRKEMQCISVDADDRLYLTDHCIVTHNTVTTIALLARLGVTSLIIVHKEFLMEQWRDRILEYTDLKEDDIGFIQQSTCDYKGKPVVIAMIQSLLSSREYPEDMYRYFGALVVDEVHRIAATEFRKAITLFPAKYRLGVTATPNRSDGLEKVFFMHIGQIEAVGQKRKIVPEVHRIDYNHKYSPNYHRYKMKNWNSEDYNLVKIVSVLVENEDRNIMLADLLYRAWRSGRKVITLTDRREHANTLMELVKDRGRREALDVECGLYLGGMKAEHREESASKRMIFACVPTDTECLTLGGWKTRDELHIGEMVASYDLRTRTIKYVPLLEVTSFDHDGDMLEVDRQSANVLMTVDHRNVVLRPVRSGTGIRLEETIVRGYDLTTGMHLRIRAPIDYPETSGIGEDLAELIGWVISEGSYIGGNRAKDIRIYQNVGAKADRIDALLSRLGIETRRREYTVGQVSWGISAKDSKTIRTYCPDKVLNEFLVSLPIAEAQRLFDALIDGDGHRRLDSGRISFIQKDSRTVDWFMILALRLGYSPLKRLRKDGMFVVYLTKKEFIRLYDGSFHVKKVKFSGEVWCPRTEHGTWIARRNGSVFVTGNTYNMAQEGLDIPDIDTLMMATPRYRIEQAFGRITRHFEGKQKPLVVDIVDTDIPLCVDLHKGRERIYRKENFIRK